jgi:hypothetical protein
MSETQFAIAIAVRCAESRSYYVRHLFRSVNEVTCFVRIVWKDNKKTQSSRENHFQAGTKPYTVAQKFREGRSKGPKKDSLSQYVGSLFRLVYGRQ